MGRGRDREKWEKNRRGARRKMGDGVQEREEQAGGALRAKTNETAECVSTGSYSQNVLHTSLSEVEPHALKHLLSSPKFSTTMIHKTCTP